MKIGLFESGLPNFANDAGSTAIIELCDLAQKLGHNIEYIYSGENPWGREDDLVERGINVIKNVDGKLDFLITKQYDVAIISRPGPAAQWLNDCEKASLPIIYFGHDIHHIRLSKGNDYLTLDNEKTNKIDLLAIAVLEKNIWKRVNLTIYPSDLEAKIVNSYCGAEKAISMPIYDMHKARLEYDFYCKQVDKKAITGKMNLLFLGGYNHKPNYDGINWFIKQVCPLIKNDFELNIIGSWPENVKRQLVGSIKNINFLGVISQDDLYENYRNCSLAIAPLRYGAGVKRKVVEALSFEIPIISTEVGFEGIKIPEALKGNLCVDLDGYKYANVVDEIFNSKTHLLNRQLKEFSSKIISIYSYEHRKKQLEKALSCV